MPFSQALCARNIPMTPRRVSARALKYQSVRSKSGFEQGTLPPALALLPIPCQCKTALEPHVCRCYICSLPATDPDVTRVDVSAEDPATYVRSEGIELNVRECVGHTYAQEWMIGRLEPEKRVKKEHKGGKRTGKPNSTEGRRG